MFDDLVNLLAQPLRAHIDDVALALVATLLVISGDKINQLLRLLVRKRPLWLRMLAFIALCSVGYGALSVWLTPRVEMLLGGLSAAQLLMAVLGSFILIALIAQKQRQL